MFIGNDGLQLSHEVELYSAGHLVAWVKVPSLSSSVNTTLYMYYGNAAAENQEDPAGVWDSNFVMVQHLSETSGTHYDSTVNGNNGLPVNGVVQGAAGKFDGADDFDGSNDYVSVSHSSTITGFSQAFTASFWVKMDSITGRRTFLNKWNTNSQRAWMIDYDSSRGANALGLFVSADGSSYSYWYASFSPAAGNWYHIAVIWQSGQQPVFYVNGAAVAATTSTVRASIYNNSLEPLYVGRSYLTSGRYFDGVIDEARISNSARSAQWIQTCYNNQMTPSDFYTVGPEESSGAPIVSNPYPLDGTVNVPRSLSFLLFDLSDPDGDPMDYYVSTDPYVGGDFGIDQGDDTYFVSVSGLDYITTYTWHVDVTDGLSWTNMTYTFTTELEPMPPIVSDPYPIDGATDMTVYLGELSVMISDPNGDLMNIMGTTDPNIGFSEGINIPDTPFTIPVSGLSPDTIYTWHVNVTDGIFWTNMTYHFTTGSEPEIRFKALTIDHSLVAGNLMNFPVLIDITDSDLANYAQPDGSDIYFTDIIPTDIDHIQLSHEIEFYGGGHLVAWVKVPTLSSFIDTTLYMCYGDPGAGAPQNPFDVWDSDFMVVQHLSETSGTHYDSTINGNNGSPVNGVVQGTTGKIDGADDFDGSNDYVTVSHSSTITGFAQALTASFWIKMDSISGRRTFLNKWNTNSQRAWMIDYDSSRGANALGFFVSADGSAYSYWYAAFSPVAGNWYHVAVVWQSGQQPIFYVNGAAVAATTSTVRATVYNNSLEPLYIGRSYTAGRYFDGVIDEVCISNSARSAQWIQTCYNNQMNPAAFFHPQPHPTVVGHVPEVDATGVLVTTTVEVTFSVAMDWVSTESAFSLDSVSGSFAWSLDNTTMTFTPSSALAYDTSYTAAITTAAMSQAGQNLESLYSWSFATELSPPPHPIVVGHVPGVDATGVVVTTTVEVIFSVAMDRASTEGAFSLDSILGIFIWSLDNTTVTFTPASPLAYDTFYSATISTAAMSQAGQYLESIYGWSFTTIEHTWPYVVSHAPSVDATDVLVTSPIQVTFSEPMDRASTQAAFSMTPFVLGSFSWDSGNLTVTFTPASSLAYDTVYTVTVSTEAMDLQGENMLAPYSWSFTTELPPPPPPTVVSHVPGVDATGVLVTTTVEVAFSEAMDRVSTESAFSLDAVSGSFTWSLDNTTMTFTPSSALAHDTIYTATITTAAMSQAGQYLESTYGWSFTTELPPPPHPTVVSHVPGVDATGVLVTTTVQVIFSEPMDRVSTESAFSLDSILGTFAWSLDNITMTFTPTSNLAYDTIYTVTISTAAMSQAGQYLELTYSWNFTTKQRPIVVGHVPSVDATDVLVTTAIQVTFNEPMDRISTEGAFSLDSVSGSFAWSLDNTTMTFTPASPMAYDTLYTVTMTDAAKSMQGDSLMPYSWSFTTELPPPPNPIVESHVPVDGAIGVPVAAAIEVTFSEPMDWVSTESAFSISPFVSGSFSWSFDNTTLTFTPGASLAYDTLFTATISTAAMSQAGQYLESPYTWSFTTVAHTWPYVVSHVPSVDETDVLTTTTIKVTFSEPMDRGSTESALSTSPSVSGSFTWSFDNATMTFTPTSNLAYDTVYTVTISTEAMDAQGENMLAPYSWSFTTEVPPPYLVGHVPGVDETGVSVTTVVQVTFTESMDHVSTEGAFSISPSASGSFTWSFDDTTMTFTPASPMAYDTLYTATVTTSAMSQAGKYLESLYTWSFTTKQRPTVTSHVPSVDATDVLVATTVQVSFSEPMDRISTESAFSLDFVSGSFSWDLGNTTMTFIPSSDLAYGTVYTVMITDAANSMQSDSLVSYSWSFTTELPPPPTVVNHVPSADATGVLVTAIVEVVFSEAMDRVSTESAFSLDSVSGSFTWSLDNITMTFIPSTALAYDTVYTATITTAAMSQAGQYLELLCSWSFTTRQRPAVISHVPGVDATDVPVATMIQVTFSEPMDRVSTENAFSISPSVLGSFSWDIGNTTMTFDPTSDLAYGTVYAVMMTDAASSMQGDSLIPYTWGFTAEAFGTAPYVKAVTPVPGAQNVSQYVNIVVYFSESMNQALTQGAFSTSPSVLDVRLSSFSWLNASAMVFNPFLPLKHKSSYTVTISTAATDLESESMLAPYIWSFTTNASTAPYITLVDRPANFTHASLITSIRFTFSEAMDHASVENGFSINPWVNGTFGWSGNRITFAPVSPLNTGTTYTVTISTGAMDLQDEHMEEPFSFSFTTIPPDPPEVIWTTPANGTTNVVNTIWGIKFSEAMDDDLVEAAFSINVTGTIGVNYYLDFRWVNSSYVEFYLAPLTRLRGYNVTISTAARDNQGENMTAPYWWNFTTGDVGGNNRPPNTQLWSHSVSGLGSGEASPLIADVIPSIQGEEVIYVGGDVGGSSGAVLCLNGRTGAEIWRYTDTSIGWNVQPQMGDINNDGEYEIIVPCYYPTGVLVLHADGTRYWKRTGLGGSTYTSKPLVVDPDGDGYWMIFCAPEDVLGYGYTDTYTSRIWAFNYEGREIKNGLWGTAGGSRSATGGANAGLSSARYQWFAWRPCSGGFAMADTDNDGLFELYQNDRHMYYGDGCYGKGTIAWEWNATSQSLQLKWYQPDMLVSSHTPLLVDVNKDGVLDVVVAHMRGGLAVFNSTTGAEMKKDYNIGLPSHYQPVVCDFDRDGNIEIILADGDHPSNSPPDIVVFDLYKWVTGVPPADCIDARMYVGPCKFPPTVGEVTGDGILDLIAVSDKGIFIFDGSHDPSVDHTYPVTVVATGLNFQCMYAVVQDIDDDGLNEIVTQTSGYRVYAYNTLGITPSPRARSEVQYYNERRTGVAEYVPPVFYDRTAPIVSNPAPSREATGISTSLSQLRFTLTDLQDDMMDYTVTANFPVDPADLIGTNEGDGMYTVDVNGPLEYHRKYIWSVHVTDGAHWNNKTYTFTTLDGTPPGSPPEHDPPLLVSSGIDDYENATSRDIICTSQNTHDPDSDEVTNIYRWLRNGQSIANVIMPFDTNSLTTAKDYSGFNNNGQVHGATWTSNGKIGGAYSFDGLDDYMVISDGGAGYYNGRRYSSNLGGYGNWYEMTVEMWINLTALSTKESTRILMKIPSYEIGLGSIGGSTRANNRLTAAVWLDNPDSGNNAGPPNSDPKAEEYWSVSAPSSMPLSINTWYHVAFTYKDGGGTSNSILTLYINGIAVTTSTSRTTRGPIKTSSGEPLFIGWYDYFKGMIDEIRIYSRALSAEQISQRYSETQNGLTSNSTLNNKETKTGETWTCQVIPNDSHQDGTARTSNPLVVLPGPQVPPVVSNVQVWGQWTLSTSRVWSNETLITVYDYFDENDDPEVLSGSFSTQITWLRNSTHVPALDNLLSLSPSITTAHEDWTFRIKPGDGHAVASEWVNATNKVIVNSPPEVTSYDPHYGETMNSLTMYIGDSETFSFTYTDMDGDPVTIQWQVNSVTVVENVLSYTWTATEVGSFTVRARITDTGYGSTTTTQSWSIVVRG
jgi:hypothetical protein